MTMTDPIADMLTRTRNACQARHAKVDIPASRIKQEIARVLLEQRFIKNYAIFENGPKRTLRLYLKYSSDGQSVIASIQRVSKPGRRQYVSVAEIPRVLNGLGIAILSTAQGIMTDQQARGANLGGELLCQVW